MAEKWGRRWITTDTSGVANAIARQRLLSATYDYYHLQDSAEGAAEEARLSGKPPEPAIGDGRGDLDAGFVYERVPRVSAAILAYDLEVEPILLVNRPLKKKGVVRVASPFTVESHSPWRYLPPDDIAQLGPDQLDTRQRIVDAVQVTGIDSEGGNITLRDIADWGEPSVVTHTAVAIDPEGVRSRVALVITPDDQSAGAALIARAAETAADKRYRRLIVIAFDFDHSVHSGPEHLHGVEIIKAQANRDFQIPGLKDNPADHAFVMIGQPDIAVHDEGGGRISVEVRGYDTYNPTTGNVERGRSGDIDCWMVDTDYRGDVFNARRIHLPNSKSDKRIARFRRQLGKNIDPSLWQSMQSLRSAPFPRPTGDTPRIAVRIISTTDMEMTVELPLDSLPPA